MDPEIARGFLFEQIEAAKYNADAASKGLSERAHVRGDNDPYTDLEIGQQKFQLKAGKNAPKEFERYPDEVRRVTTKGGRDLERGIEDEVAYGGASSGGTTERELQFGTKHPRTYAAAREMGQVGTEAAVAGLSGATYGAIIGGANSAIENLWEWRQGEKSGKQAVKDTAKGAVKSAGRGGAGAAGSSVVRYIGHKTGLAALKKANVASAVASGLVEVSATVRSWVKGDISAEEAAIRLGDTGCGALSGIYVGAAAGAVFGPVGAMAGSAVGYMLSACVYQSCVATFQSARLAEAEAERVVALCADAARRMDEQRRQFERDAAEWLEARQKGFDRHFEKIDDALAGGDPKKSAKCLSRFALSFGKKLKYVEFDDFLEFMDSKEPLVL